MLKSHKFVSRYTLYPFIAISEKIRVVKIMDGSYILRVCGKTIGDINSLEIYGDHVNIDFTATIDGFDFDGSEIECDLRTIIGMRYVVSLY